MSDTKILAFAGSVRKDSFNQKLLDVASHAAEAAGGQVTRLDLSEFPLPMFNEDLEKQSAPDRLGELRGIFLEHHGILIASPEYNSSVTPLLKNTIDWVSRATGQLPPCAAFHGKVAGLLAASPGGMGGLRGLVHLRSILQNIGTMVIPNQFALSRAFEAFDESGQLHNEKQQSAVTEVVQSVLSVAEKLNS